MDELLKAALNGGPWVLCVAAFAWAYLRDTRMAARLDEMQKEQVADLKGALTNNTAAMEAMRSDGRKTRRILRSLTKNVGALACVEQKRSAPWDGTERRKQGD